MFFWEEIGLNGVYLYKRNLVFCTYESAYQNDLRIFSTQMFIRKSASKKKHSGFTSLCSFKSDVNISYDYTLFFYRNSLIKYKFKFFI